MRRFVVGVLVGVVFCILFLYSINIYRDAQLQENYARIYKEEMHRWLKDSNIEDFTGDAEPGSIVFPDGNFRLSQIPSPWEPYAVKVDSAVMPLNLNRAQDTGIEGLVGLPGFDEDIDFSEDECFVIEYDSSNGTLSNGDIIYCFRGKNL